jgi:hypothetical protein
MESEALAGFSLPKKYGNDAIESFLIFIPPFFARRFLFSQTLIGINDEQLENLNLRKVATTGRWC